MRQKYRNGSAHVLIVVSIVVVICAALGYVFYNNFIAKSRDSGQKVSSPAASTSTVNAAKKNTIVAVDGTDMMRYTNNHYGFQFDFPRQTYTTAGCEVQKQWYDNYGKLYDAPVTAYTSTYGMVDMGLLESENLFTIVQKQAPLFTSATYGSDQRQYNSGCTVAEVTQALIDTRASDLLASYRSWQVYKLSSQDEIAKKAKELQSLPYNDNVTATHYSLGPLENGRQAVTYSFTYDPSDGFVGGGASKTWYYPEQKLLVHIGLGQEVSFQKDSTSNAFYIDEIVDSFTVL